MFAIQEVSKNQTTQTIATQDGNLEFDFANQQVGIEIANGDDSTELGCGKLIIQSSCRGYDAALHVDISRPCAGRIGTLDKRW